MPAALKISATFAGITKRLPGKHRAKQNFVITDSDCPISFSVQLTKKSPYTIWCMEIFLVMQKGFASAVQNGFRGGLVLKTEDVFS